MKTQQSYFICMNPRTGSSFLAEALKATGQAGVPEEYYNAADMDALLKEHACTTFAELHTTILGKGTTENGVFGTQVSTAGGIERLIDVVSGLTEYRSHEKGEKRRVASSIRRAFPNLKFVHLTRRNKVRQAVSWWKAVQTNQWILREGDQRAPNEKAEYVFAAIDSLVQQTVLREAGWQAFYEMMEVTPVVVVYEDLVAHVESTIRRVLDALDLPHVPAPTQVPKIKKQADDLSEEWVQRYREEKQRGWDYIGWDAAYLPD